MSAFGFLGLGDSASWKEEVLLHDGRKIVVERTQIYGSKPTIDSREGRLLEEKWMLPLPGSKQQVIWENNFRMPPGGQSLTLVLVGFVDDVPYLATSPAGCIAYNHWGRPNPPYVFFRHDGKGWKRIPLVEFPMQLKEANVVVGRPKPPNRSGVLTVATVQEDNRLLEPHHRVIVREPIKVAQTVDCEELIYYKEAWIMPNDPIARGLLDRKSKSNNTK